MANFLSFKKKNKDEADLAVSVEAIESSETSETTERNEPSMPDITNPENENDIDVKFFGKSLSYLSEEKKRLEARGVELQEKLSNLKNDYASLLDRRQQVSVEQQQALSDFNEVSLDYLKKEVSPAEEIPAAAQDASKEDYASLEERKAELQGMKAVETEKEGISAQLDKELFDMAETIGAVRAEIDYVAKTQTAIDKAIEEAGLPEPELNDEADGFDIKGKAFKIKRKIAGKVRGINFLNLPTYLKNDCEVEYASSKLIINYAIVFVAIVLIGMLYSLKVPYVLMLCLIYFVFGPSLVYFHHRKKYEKKKFEVCVRYIEQMIFSFTRRSKLLIALQETRVLMSGKVAEAIDFAIAKIQNGKSNADLYKDALKEIEEIFPCARVKNLHELLIDVERIGGKHTSSLDIMLEDVREWDVRSNNFQQEQTVKGMSMIISILMSLGVCFFMTNVLPDDMGGDISGFLGYQIVTTISLIVMFFIYRFSARKLTSSWVNDDLGEDGRRIKADYETVKNYVNNPVGKIKPILAMTRIQTAMEKAFPRWVMRFSLLASSRPIPVALAESVDAAPLVMRDELAKLTENLESDPYGIQPYINFFEGFDMPQVRSMMMMVYSLGSADSSDVQKHVLSIVKRNHLLQATAEKIEYDEKMSMFTLFSTVPMLLACVIMMIDVAMIVLNMLNTVM